MDFSRRILIAFLAATSVCSAAPNVLLICVDDLRPELGCYGASHISSPHIDALAKQSRLFTRHFVQAPTCGASRYALLTGQYGPADNNAIFKRAQGFENQSPKDSSQVPTASLPAWFRQHGYITSSIGKVSHHPGGWGGPDWDDPTQPEMPLSWDRSTMPTGLWKHPRGAMHGLANGEIRLGKGTMSVYQSFDGPDSSYPDGLIADQALQELKRLLAGDQPFFLAVGLIRPHLPFGAPRKYFDHYRDTEFPPIPHPAKPAGRTTWHRSGEFMQYNRWSRDPREDQAFALEVRRHYAACVSYADAQVGRLLKALDEQTLAQGNPDETIVVLWGDHGWHLGEHGVWGKHTLFEESLRSPLLIRTAGLPTPGKACETVAETIDVYPTLCELANLPKPEFLTGASLARQLSDPSTRSKGFAETAISYSSNAKTLRTATHRLIVHSDGYLELYDHTSPEKETHNVAQEQPEVAQEMLAELREKLSSR